jgi:hypothetical protein
MKLELLKEAREVLTEHPVIEARDKNDRRIARARSLVPVTFARVLFSAIVILGLIAWALLPDDPLPDCPKDSVDIVDCRR